MARKLALIGLVLLLLASNGLAQGDSAGPTGATSEDDSTIGNDGDAGAAASPGAAEAAPVGGPVPAGAFSATEYGAGGLAGNGDETDGAASLEHSALLAALGLGTILSFFC